MPRRMPLLLTLLLAISFGLRAAEPVGEKMKTLLDLEYAEVDGNKLQLDLFLPANAKNPPLVVYIHGGGWRSGSRKENPLKWLVARGYALASIEYRLSSVAVFPAQIHDCKGAIRWLRAHTAEYGYDAGRIAVTGTSAGGHLAVLLGTSGDEPDLEGKVGGNLDQSSRVQAIVDYYGPTDFVLRSTDQPKETEQKGGKVYSMLGRAVQSDLELAKQASGAFHVTQDDPPLLIFHGTADRTVLQNQSHRLRDAYTTAGLPVEFQTVEGAGHGGPGFWTPDNRELAGKFIDRWLKAKPAEK